MHPIPRQLHCGRYMELVDYGDRLVCRCGFERSVYDLQDFPTWRERLAFGRDVLARGRGGQSYPPRRLGVVDERPERWSVAGFRRWP
jgi:hypothetical protein